MNEIDLGIFDHILLFLLGVVLPAITVFLIEKEPIKREFDTPIKKQLYYENGVFQWICVFFTVLVWWGSSRSFADLGFQIGTWTRPAWILLIIFCTVYLLDVWWGLRNEQKIMETKARWVKEIPILPAKFEEFKYFLFVAFSAGVCEEIIFRGFFIQYFLAINENNDLGNWLAVIIPACLFAFGHLYQGGKAAIKILGMSILFGWIFILTKSLLLLMLIHFLLDVLGGFLAYRILKNETIDNADNT